MQHELYPHNQYAYNKLVEHFETESKGCIIQPTGTGKSYIIDKLIRDNPNKEFIIFTSQSFIIEQFISLLPTRNNVYLYTYHSLLSSKLKEILQHNPDYIILDEFHRAGASKWHSSIKRLFDIYKLTKILGLSATPTRTDKTNDRKILKDMSSILFDNNIIHYLSLKSAIDHGILPAPHYIKSLYSIKSESEKLIRKINHSKKADDIKLIDEIKQTTLNWKSSHGVDLLLNKHITTEKNFVIFFKSVNHLKQFKTTVVSWFSKGFNTDNVNTYIVHSYLKNTTGIINDYQNKINSESNYFNLLLAVDQLNEGVHLNNIDGVIFLRPTQSHIVYLQQLGRCLSSKGKRPIVIDLVNNFKSITHFSKFAENKLTDLNFRKNVSFTKEESEHIKKSNKKHLYNFTIVDETLKYQSIFNSLSVNNHVSLTLDEIILTIQSNKHDINLIKRRLTDYRSRYKLNTYQLSQEVISKLDKITKLLNLEDWRISRIQWDVTYEKHYNKGITRQNQWLTRQTQAYYANKLSSEQVDKLDKLSNKYNLFWREITIKKSWNESYNELKDSLLNQIELTKDQKRWIQKQRQSRKEGTLAPKSEELLNQLNPLFKATLNQNKWHETKRTVRTWEESYDHIKNGASLGKTELNWFKRNRNLYRNNKLSKIKIEKLNKLISIIGYDWKEGMHTIMYDSWDVRLKQIISKENLTKGDYDWIGRHKRLFLQGKLSKSKIEKLNQLNNRLAKDWNSVQRPKWEDTFKLVKSDLEKNIVARSNTNWIIRQRKVYTENKLTQEKITQLNTLNPLLGYDWKLGKFNSK